MSLKIAIQMDPIEMVDPFADTTFDMALDAKGRGFEIWVYGPAALALEDGRLSARAQKILRLSRAPSDHVSLAPVERLDLHEMDVVLMRQDPPFDMAYITATHLLEHLAPDVLVLNNPVHVRNAPEKLFVTHFKDVAPPTLISADPEALAAFRGRHKDIVLKPLFGAGGAGVFRVKPDDGNFNALLEMFAERSREPIIAQAFLPDVAKGDKRVLLLNGEPVGAINRVPQAGETRSNMHVGGRAEASELTADDRRICDVIGPALRDMGLVLVGIDVIGGALTEINVTSPTGVQELRRFGGPDISALFWDWVVAQM